MHVATLSSQVVLYQAKVDIEELFIWGVGKSETMIYLVLGLQPA